MISDWTYHLKDPEEKERFVKYIKNNRTILERLSAILLKWDNETASTEISEKSYESPSWTYKQADTNGYRRCIRDIQKLLNLDPKEK